MENALIIAVQFIGLVAAVITIMQFVASLRTGSRVNQDLPKNAVSVDDIDSVDQAHLSDAHAKNLSDSSSPLQVFWHFIGIETRELLSRFMGDTWTDKQVYDHLKTAVLVFIASIFVAILNGYNLMQTGLIGHWFVWTIIAICCVCGVLVLALAWFRFCRRFR